ncbi:uncharacterized protein V6R79_016742 [Siganus canaliculatus]
MESARLGATLVTVFSLFTFSTALYPKAQNVTWKSINFKTVLTWEPKPLSDYSYTVEYSVVGGDIQKNTACIRSTSTVCDLSTSLTDLHATYTADVLSGPLLGVSVDQTEFPYTSSLPFCPYKDTEIGKPDFKLEVSQETGRTTLYVTDPLTALFKDGRQLNMRDIFADQLQYKVTYRRNKSTGKKVYNSNTNVIELTDLDRGESYCFSVQAYIPSRSNSNRQLGEPSRIQCSSDDHGSILEVFSVGVIAAAIFLVVLLIGIIVTVIVVCCKCRKKALKSGKEGVPLRDV